MIVREDRQHWGCHLHISLISGLGQQACTLSYYHPDRGWGGGGGALAVAEAKSEFGVNCEDVQLRKYKG